MKTAHACLGAVLSSLLISAPALSQTSVEPRVAIEGYDPVAYFTERRPVKGAPAIFQDFDGSRYYFASARHREMFVAQPDRYIPQFGANCAGLMSAGKIKRANPIYWVIVDDRLYLFASVRGPEYLAKNPGALAKARRHWASMR